MASTSQTSSVALTAEQEKNKAYRRAIHNGRRRENRARSAEEHLQAELSVVQEENKLLTAKLASRDELEALHLADEHALREVQLAGQRAVFEHSMSELSERMEKGFEEERMWARINTAHAIDEALEAKRVAQLTADFAEEAVQRARSEASDAICFARDELAMSVTLIQQAASLAEEQRQ